MSHQNLLTASVACVLIACGAHAGEYFDYEKTAAWFATPVQSLSDGAIPAALPWTVPAGGEATVQTVDEVKQIVLDADAKAPLVYTPALANGPITYIRSRAQISVNQTVPDVSDFADAQAALTVLSEDGNLSWMGLVGGGEAAWQKMTSSVEAVDGAWFDIQIEIDNKSATHRVRYSVKPVSADAYSVLVADGHADGWFANPKSAATTVSSVAFAGTATLGDFSGEALTGVTLAVDDPIKANGCDFTNGTVSVTASVTEETGTFDKKLVLTVTRPDGGSTACERDLSSASWPLNDLTPGSSYSYKLDVVIDGDVVSTTGGTFVAATVNGGAASWIATDYAAVTGGTWAPALDWDGEKKTAAVAGNVFTLDDAKANVAEKRLVTVDTAISFEGGCSEEDLEAPSSDMQGAIAVVETDSGLVWEAVSGDAWTALSGVTPVVGHKYVVRAEFDYRGVEPRVSFLISEDEGVTFTRLTSAAGAWLAVHDTSATKLTSVAMTGSGTFACMNGFYADEDVAVVGGNGYKTLADALVAANGAPVTLKTDVTWAPTACGSWAVGGGTVYPLVSGNWQVLASDGKLLATDHDIAAIGAKTYPFLETAFAEAEANATVTLLTNWTSGASIEVGQTLTLDLAGSFLRVADPAKIAVADAKALTVTNSTTDAIGGVAASFTGTHALVAGYTADTNATVPTLYAYASITPVTVDGAEYNYEVIAKSADSDLIVPVKGLDEKTVANLAVSPAWIESVTGVRPVDAAEAAVELAKTGTNGMTLLQSLILGLDPIQAASIPVVASEQNADPDTVTLSLGNVVPGAAPGVPVRFQLVEATTPTGEGKTLGEPQAETSFNVLLDDATVKYYRINILIGQ